MQFYFHGAAGEVTGSCFRLVFHDRSILIDCGLLQGGHDAAVRNRAPFSFAAAGVTAVLLTHAHLDHSGRLPLLCRRGFGGPIYAHPATADLCAILWCDAAGLLAQETEVENRKNKRRVKPLYDKDDVAAALARFTSAPYGEWREITPGVRCRFHDAGHILGAASLELVFTEAHRERRLLISGDLGPYNAPLMRDPRVPARADYIVMECTYGDRLHRSLDETLTELAGIINEAAKEGGNVLFPAFAVGRSQLLLYEMARHRREWGLDRFQIFLDSPLAIQATDIYRRHAELFSRDTAAFAAAQGRDFLPELQLVESSGESKAINDVAERTIVIAGSGMMTGGRILHHLSRRLGNPRNHVVVTGYQAAGTLGRRLVNGAKTVRLYDAEVAVRAKIHTLGGFSAHGDRDDLTRWYRAFAPPPRLYLVHGETHAAQGLRDHLKALQLTDAIIAKRETAIDLR